MVDNEIISEIVKLLYKNNKKMLRTDIRKETGLEYIDFLKSISKLEKLGYIRTYTGSQIKYHRNIYLSDHGGKIAKQLII